MAATSGPTTDHRVGPISELRAKWGWFVALGVAMLIAGLLALGNSSWRPGSPSTTSAR